MVLLLPWINNTLHMCYFIYLPVLLIVCLLIIYNLYTMPYTNLSQQIIIPRVFMVQIYLLIWTIVGASPYLLLSDLLFTYFWHECINSYHGIIINDHLLIIMSSIITASIITCQRLPFNNHVFKVHAFSDCQRSSSNNNVFSVMSSMNYQRTSSNDQCFNNYCQGSLWWIIFQ